MLLERLEKQINELTSMLDEDALKIDESFISEIDSFATSVLDNVDFLADSSVTNEKIDNYVGSVYKDSDIDIDVYKKELKSLKKYTEVLSNPDTTDALKSLIKLDEKQLDFIKKVCEDSKKFIASARKRIEENKKIQSSTKVYKDLTSKLNGDKSLDLEDYKSVLELIDSSSDIDKFKILKEFLYHNIDVEKSKEQNDDNDNSEIDIVEETDSNSRNDEIVHLISDEEIESRINKVIEIFKDNEDDEKKLADLIRVIKRRKEEIALNVDMDNIKPVLEALKDKNIYHKFESEGLVALALYGTNSSINEAYDYLTNNPINGKNLLDTDLVYKYSGIWAIQDEEFRNSRIRFRKNAKDVNISLKTIVRSMSRKDLYDRIENINGYNLFAKEDLLLNYSKLLDCSIEDFNRQMKILEKYHIDLYKGTGNFKVKAFDNPSSLLDLSDIAIESGILDIDGSSKNNRSYANNNVSWISKPNYLDRGHALLLQALNYGIVKDSSLHSYSFDDCFGHISSKTGERVYSNKFNSEFINEYFGFDLDNEEGMKKFMIDQDMTFVSSLENSNIDEMRKVIDNNLINNDEKIINSDFIKDLDSKYLKNDSKYVVDGKIISRYKVLRVYESLMKYNEANPESKFDEKDIEFFALTYNSFLKNSTYEKLKDEVYEDQRRRGI